MMRLAMVILTYTDPNGEKQELLEGDVVALAGRYTDYEITGWGREHTPAVGNEGEGVYFRVVDPVAEGATYRVDFESVMRWLESGEAQIIDRVNTVSKLLWKEV